VQRFEFLSVKRGEGFLMRNPLLRPMSIVIVVVAGIFLYLKSSRLGQDAQNQQETLLKQDLRAMRGAIDEYTIDRKELPHSLDDLVQANYLEDIPVDPVCRQRGWNLHFGPSPLSESPAAGLDDVSSTCDKIGSNGAPYNTW
jgi:general secretion pathway protein G